MPSTTKLITAEELLDMGDIGPCELVNGEIVMMTPAGAEHGDVALEIAYLIKAFVKSRRLGKVYAAETGFTLKRNPDTTRGADVAFVSKKRLPKGTLRGYFPGAPDLAVEVVSPGDRVSKVLAKVDEWLEGGATSVWVVDPPTRSIEVYRRGSQPIRYKDNEMLSDEPTLPSFTMKLTDVFDAED